MNSLVLCFTIVVCFTLYLPCQAKVEETADVQPNPQPTEPESQQPKPTPEQTKQENVTPPSQPFIPPNLLLSSLQPILPKLPSFRLAPPPFSPVPSLVSPQIFLQPDPLFYIINTIAELPSNLNVNEQIFILQKTLQESELSSSFVTYIQGILFLLQNHDHFKSFLESIEDIKRQLEYKLSISGRGGFGPQFDMNASLGRGGFGINASGSRGGFGLKATANPDSLFGLPNVQAFTQSFFSPSQQALSFDPITAASYDQQQTLDYDGPQDDYEESTLDAEPETQKV